MQNFSVFTAHTAAQYFWLIFLTLFSIGCICAFALIFKKSGFSSWWTLVPATPTLLTLALLYLVFFVPQSISTGLGTVTLPSTTGTWPDLMKTIDVLDALNVIAFFVFSIVPWPVERELAHLRVVVREARNAAFFANVRTPSRSPSASPAPSVSTPAPSPTTMAMTRVPPAGGGRPGFGPATAVLVAPALTVVPASSSFYCSWCGKERHRDAQSIHHCGSRTRPPSFCTSCGRSIDDASQCCDGCGTPATTLSPP